MEWNAEEYRNHFAFVSKLAADLVDVLNPQPKERILDIGCGDGSLTEIIAARGAQVQCIDLSADMARIAQKRGIPTTVMDAHTLNQHDCYDAIFSNAALHWMNPNEVLPRVYRALKPNGRFVAEQGGYGNLRTFCDCIAAQLAKLGLKYDRYDPFYFPTKEEHVGKLRAAGFSIDTISIFDRPTTLPEGIQGWLRRVSSPFRGDIPDGKQDMFIDQLIECLRPQLANEDDRWTIDYVRCRFVAYKK